MERLRSVHQPWTEQTEESQVNWEPDLADWYTGPEGGSDAGPSAKMKEVVRAATNLTPLFVFVLPLLF